MVCLDGSVLFLSDGPKTSVGRSYEELVGCLRQPIAVFFESPNITSLAGVRRAAGKFAVFRLAGRLIPCPHRSDKRRKEPACHHCQRQRRHTRYHARRKQWWCAYSYWEQRYASHFTRSKWFLDVRAIDARHDEIDHSLSQQVQMRFSAFSIAECYEARIDRFKMVGSIRRLRHGGQFARPYLFLTTQLHFALRTSTLQYEAHSSIILRRFCKRLPRR